MKKDDNHGIGFDFDIGEAKCSPCRNCFQRSLFPGCMADCKALDHFQRVLSRTVSCSRQSGSDNYTVYRPDHYRPDI